MPEFYPREFHNANDFCCRSAFDIMIVKSIKYSDFIRRIITDSTNCISCSGKHRNKWCIGFFALWRSV